MSEPRTPAEEILRVLEPDEHIEAVSFGRWGGFGEEPSWADESPPKITPEVMGRPMLWGEAARLLDDPRWRIAGDYGLEETFALWIWTNRRVLFVGCYDGATWLAGVPRNPTEGMPRLVGGG